MVRDEGGLAVGSEEEQAEVAGDMVVAVALVVGGDCRTEGLALLVEE